MDKLHVIVRYTFCYHVQCMHSNLVQQAMYHLCTCGYHSQSSLSLEMYVT